MIIIVSEHPITTTTVSEAHDQVVSPGVCLKAAGHCRTTTECHNHNTEYKNHLIEQETLKIKLEITVKNLHYYYYYFYTQGSKDPQGKKLKMLKSKCRMVIGLSGQLTECRAKAQS